MEITRTKGQQNRNKRAEVLTIVRITAKNSNVLLYPYMKEISI